MEEDEFNTSFDNNFPASNASDSTFQQKISDLKKLIKPLVNKHWSQKVVITKTINKFSDDDDPAFVQQELTEFNKKLKII